MTSREGTITTSHTFSANNAGKSPFLWGGGRGEGTQAVYSLQPHSPHPTTNCTFPTEPAANPRGPGKAGFGMNKHSTPDGAFSSVTFTQPKPPAQAGARTSPARRRAPGSQGSAGERDWAGGGWWREGRERGRGPPGQAIVPSASKDIFYRAPFVLEPYLFLA